MGLSVHIEHHARLVLTIAEGVVSKADFVSHITGTWGRAEIRGFDELIDAREADVSSLTHDDLRALADASVGVEDIASSKLALVVGTELGYGLARMYGALRQTNQQNMRDVAVFYDRQSALAWLGASAEQSAATDVSG